MNVVWTEVKEGRGSKSHQLVVVSFGFVWTQQSNAEHLKDSLKKVQARLRDEASVSDDPPPEQVPRCDSNFQLLTMSHFGSSHFAQVLGCLRAEDRFQSVFLVRLLSFASPQAVP